MIKNFEPSKVLIHDQARDQHVYIYTASNSSHHHHHHRHHHPHTSLFLNRNIQHNLFRMYTTLRPLRNRSIPGRILTLSSTRSLSRSTPTPSKPPLSKPSPPSNPANGRTLGPGDYARHRYSGGRGRGVHTTVSSASTSTAFGAGAGEKEGPGSRWTKTIVGGSSILAVSPTPSPPHSSSSSSLTSP